MPDPARVALQFQESLESFIRIELDLSLQFASAALESSNPDKVERSKENALKGYETALHFLPRAALSDPSRLSIETQIKQLRNLLTRLGVCEAPAQNSENRDG